MRPLGLRLAAVAACLACGLHAAELTGEEILKSAIKADDRQEIARHQYLYKVHLEFRVGGKLARTRDFETVFIDGESYRKLVAENGKPLGPKQVREEEAKPGRKWVRSGVPLTARLADEPESSPNRAETPSRRRSNPGMVATIRRLRPGATRSERGPTPTCSMRNRLFVDSEVEMSD